MSSLASIYIKRETLKTLLDGVSKKNMKGIEITLSINEGANEYGQNLSGYISQSKEERDAGKKKFYVGNGKVFWTDGTIEVAKKETAPANYNPDDLDDDPFS